jgi:phosphotransacetylase
MLGSILNQCLESAGETTKENYETVNQYSQEAKDMLHVELPLYKNFRGMSTKEVQKEWGKSELTTSEGVVRRNEVKYTVEGWTRNFESYLRSAMSYTGKKELHHFIGGVNFNNITQNSFRRFNK